MAVKIDPELKQGMDKLFLNDSPHESGYVSWAVTLGVGSHTYNRVSCDLKISDCSDSVLLDFNCHNTKDISKRIDKLDRLINSLVKLRASLVSCQTLATKRGLK